MASGFELGSRASRLTALALLTFVVCIPVAVVAARAPAGWQVATASSRGTGSLRIRSNRISNLYPGAKRKLTLIIHNTSKHAVRVRALRVRDVGTTKRGCAPTRRNLRIRKHKPRAFRLRSGGSRRVVFLLTMPNTVANACQKAVFDLRYKALLETSAR
jgi:hypothetical protein